MKRFIVWIQTHWIEVLMFLILVGLFIYASTLDVADLKAGRL